MITINSDSDYESTQIPVPPPDGGFGWVIVFASFLCNCIVDEISEEFNETKANTAWIGSLQGGFYLLLGPIVSALANVYGCRSTAIFGSVVAAAGFILSYFATNVTTLYFTFGLLGGIGFGFIFLPAVVIVGFYFEKRRAFATGMAVCGSEISEEFNETKANTAWIGSLQGGFYLLLGPIVSALANVYGCRSTAIFGSVVAAAGFILSYFATNVTTLYFTFGLLGGIGFGFIFLPAVVIVGFYFEKRRAFATGMAVCGSGIGAFVLAPVTQLLVESYGWRGCVLILAGITLNCAVFGSLFRPVEEITFRNQSQKPLLFRIKEARDALWTESDIEEVDEESPTASHNSAPPPYSEIVDIVNTNNTNNNTNNNSLANSTPEYEIQRDSLKLPDDDKRRRRTRSIYDESRPELISSALSLVVVRRMSIATSQTLDKSANRLSSIKSINESKEKSSPELSQELSQSKKSIASSKHSNASNESSKTWFASLKETFDLRLLSSPSFLLLSLSGFLCLTGFFIPFMYIADRAKLLGYTPEKSAFLLSVIGITNTIGRVFCGWVSDRPKVNALLINNVALTIGACFATLRSVITVELLGLERLTNAFGLLLMFQGIAVTIGSPIGGWFFDITGSYDNSFYLSGSAIALSGIMCFPLSAISKWEKGKPGFGAIN
ncbi:unnamed protein product [Medioppia subpectinata]|uniref:Major facilitator superfamily (MFS) profile domain-containing protein n=1 Tax=Medioppia subpectinata TaxID=1979941 RepID=A0A7R9KFW8_9ACAR|nr:unnamed protein product [Medioppia subpectinata]CAG2101592.1 unnamed protein product [Medioppia subpectinata]